MIYLTVIPIWIIGQTAIFLKTLFEHRRDHLAIGNIKDQEEKDNTKCMNTQRWNPEICTSHRTFFTILIVFACHIHAFNLLLKWSNLNSYEKSLLATNVIQTILCLAVPLYMYAKNKSMFQHLIHEILGEFIVIENLSANLPKLSCTIHPCTQKMKTSQKLQSKSEHIELSTRTLTGTCTGTTIRMTNEMVLNQGQKGTFDQVKEEPNHDFPKCLPYRDQKSLLSVARLKKAGFELSNNTPEDGNCLIHALKDQMR